MRNRRHIVLALATAAALAAVATACDDSGGGGGTDAGTDTGTDVDTDTDTDTDTGAEPSWDGVGLADVDAPDELTVTVGYDGTPPPADAGNAAIYALSSDVGALAVQSVAYDDAAHVATLTTDKQKLGITYTVTISPPPVGATPLTADFLSADTAAFWVLDFSDYTYEQITAERSAVGEKAVAYIQEGNVGAASSSVQNFDEHVFPTETSLFTDAPDLDGNGKIVILGLDGGNYYGGYFDPVNSLTQEEADTCGFGSYGYHTNEMEIVHVNVAYGDFDSTNEIVPHEFQHLLYEARHPSLGPSIPGCYDAGSWLDTYHNEGLAECAVRAVTGDYDQAIGYYFGDYSGLIGQGLSLVDWTYSLYENYVVAFMFWSYVAAHLGGVDGYGQIFDLDSGHPDVVDQFLLDNLGTDLGQTQLNQMLALWVRAEAGTYSYLGFLDLGSAATPMAPTGTSSLDLEPYAGTFFHLDQASVDYPGTQGADIVYAGIDSSGAVDLEAPFDVDGGALLALDTQLWIIEDYPDPYYPTEHSGPDVAGSGGEKGLARELASGAVSPTWTDPPPAVLQRPERFVAWREARLAQLAAVR